MAIADPWLIEKMKVRCTSTHAEPYEYYAPVPDPNVVCCPSIFGSTAISDADWDFFIETLNSDCEPNEALKGLFRIEG